jgi:excisionase family DNA binding protein
MDLLARLRLMPPGSLVPTEWVLAELEREQGGGKERGEALIDLTVEQVAERLGRSPSTVRNWLGEQRLPGAYRLRGREWRIPPAALTAFLQREAEGKTAGLQGQKPADLSDWRRHVRQTG